MLPAMPNVLAQRLTIRHLRLVAAILEHRQLSVAAQALALTQPAASRTLGEIERICGAAIFERHPRGMTPTPLGEMLARRARNVLQEIDEAADEVARYSSGRGGAVRIGAVTGAAIGYVVPVVHRLREEAPRAEIEVDVATSRELVRDLLAMRLDFVLARIPADADADQFEVQRASAEAIDLVVGAHHPAAGRRRVALKDLLGHDWVMQSGGAPIRLAIEETLLAAGERPPGRITNTSSLLVTIAMLASSDAVAPVSREVADLLVTTGAGGLVRLRLDQKIIVAPYSLLSIRGRRLSPVAHRARELVRRALIDGREERPLTEGRGASAGDRRRSRGS